MRISALLFILCAIFALSPPLSAPASDSDEIPIPAIKPDVKKAAKKKTVEKEKTADIPQPLKKPNANIAKNEKLAKNYQKPISGKNAIRYREIFTLQAQGDIKTADAKIKKLSDDRLMGHVLHQRYMLSGYNSSFDELKIWLSAYSDHPGAHKIHALALRKKPEDFDERLTVPQSRNYIRRRIETTMVSALNYTSSRPRNVETAQKIATLNKTIRSRIYQDRPTEALMMLKQDENTNLLDTVEYDILRGQIAASYLYNGKTDEAFDLASAAAGRSGLHVPMAGWVAGLVAWMREDYDAAARYFEITGRSNYASSWTKAAGAYWAARAHMRMGNVKEISIWLNRAVSHPRTFYGLIATRALGQDFNFDWHTPTFTKENYKILSQTRAGFRAIALVEAGQNTRAEAELIRINPRDVNLRAALLSFSSYAKLPGIALRLGDTDAALYPISPWQPESGYRVDKALIHAIARQESRFDPMAESPSGALGLMQLIPSTARSVGLQDKDDLENPAINLELGQRYLLKLQKERAVRNDIFRLLIAYNGGPGNLKKWSARWPAVNDPLLFVELIPSGETRAYVERVLSNYWIYRLRDDMPTPTLDAVTSGNPAKYAAR